jgi:hypothetical protein
VTARELISLLLRRWYVVLLCGALTLASMLLLLDRPSAYFAEFEVVLLPPLEATNTNTLRRDPYGITPMAGLMVVEFNRGKHPLDMSTTETTLYGEELTRGHRVRMRNIGNQWEPVYRDPVIDVRSSIPTRTGCCRRCGGSGTSSPTSCADARRRWGSVPPR